MFIHMFIHYNYIDVRMKKTIKIASGFGWMKEDSPALERTENRVKEGGEKMLMKGMA